MEVSEAYDIGSQVTFLDVREQYEYDGAHIDGSLHVPMGELRGRTDELDRSRPVIVVCQVGQRSDLVATWLREEGWDAHNLEGGLTEWAIRGLPLVGSEGSGVVVDGWARDLGGRLLGPGSGKG